MIKGPTLLELELNASTVETRYNECSWDHENSYVITIFSLYALDIALFQRVGTKNRVRYIYNFRYMHVRYSEFRLYKLFKWELKLWEFLSVLPTILI